MKNRIIAIILSVALFAPTATAHAGGAATGGATEVTQILNNTELMAVVEQEAATYGVNVQQYMTQMQQLQTMQTNLQSLQNSNLQGELTRFAANEAKYRLAKKRAQDLSDSTRRANTLASADIAAMRAGNMTPTQYYDHAATEAANGSVYWQGALEANQTAISDVQEKSAAFKEFAAKNGDIVGNVSGFQRLDAQNSMMNESLMDMNIDFKQMIAMKQSEMAEKKLAEKKAADQAARYGKARADEAQAIRDAFRRPQN